MAEKITTIYDFDIQQALANLDKLDNRLGSIAEAQRNSAKQNPFVGATTATAQYNKMLGEQSLSYSKVTIAIHNYTQEQERVKRVMADIAKGQRELVAAADYATLKKQIGQVETALEKANQPLKEANSWWDKLKAKFSGGLKVPKIDLNTPTLPDAGAAALRQRDANGRISGGGNTPGGGLLGGLTGGGKGLLGNLLGGGGLGSAVGQLAGFLGISVGVAEGLRTAVVESAAFGKALSELSAITGVTGKDLDYLADQAVDLETKTGIAAKDIVEGFKLVGSIKPELLGSKEALADVTTQVIALSQASGLSLQDAATAAVGALNQFGEEADQAARFVNVLAAGAKVGASEVNDTAEALKVSGTAMKAAGLSFEQGNAIIQSLAGVMIKGSEAGTGLRNTLIKLETQSDKNLRPSVVGLDKALENASKKFDTTTELAKVFGQENIVASRRILDTRTEISGLTKDLTGTNVAYEQQRTNLNNLSTDLSKAGTQTTATFRFFAGAVDGFLRGVVQGYSATLQAITGKTSAFAKFFTATFTSGTFNPILATQRGLDAAFAQADANSVAARQAAQMKGVKTAAVQGVTDDTAALTKLYQQQGEAEPKAKEKAVKRVAELRQQELADARAQHEELKKLATEEGAFSGKASEATVKKYDQQFQQSRQRILAAQTAYKTASSELARDQKARADQAAALKSALGEGPSDADKKKGVAKLKADQDNYKLLLSAQEEYVKEYQKLQDQFGKDRLEELKKDDLAYIDEKARLDKAELDATEQHFRKMLQLADSNKTIINKAGQREVVANIKTEIPADVQKQFDDARAAIDAKAARDKKLAKIAQDIDLLNLQRKTNATELEIFDKHYDALITQAINAGKKQDYVKALELKRDQDRNTLQANQLIEDEKRIEAIELSNIESRQKRKDETLGAFAKRNALDTVATQIKSAENVLFGLEKQDDPQNTPEIARLNAYIKALKDKRDEINGLQPVNRDIYDLLGISKSFKNDAEREKFDQALGQIKQSVLDATAIIIQSSEERIQAIEGEIQEKQKQITEEEDRAKEGYANNLSLRQQELADLKQQKEQEQQARKKALILQQTLDSASIISTNAVTTANLISAAAESFAGAARNPLGPVLGVIQAIAAIALIFTTMLSVRSKFAAISKLRDGGRIPLNGRSHEAGGHRIEGTDIEVERGEHVINAKASEEMNETLTAINGRDYHRAFYAIMREGGFGMPDFVAARVRNNEMRPAVGFSTVALEKKMDELTEEIRHIRNNTKQGKQYFGTPDDYVEVDGTRTVRHKK